MLRQQNQAKWPNCLVKLAQYTFPTAFLARKRLIGYMRSSKYSARVNLWRSEKAVDSFHRFLFACFRAVHLRRRHFGT